jgi:hypothetical protein
MVDFGFFWDGIREDGFLGCRVVGCDEAMDFWEIIRDFGL